MKKIISLILCILCITASITSYADSKITVYAPDGRTSVIWKSELSSWKATGWYDYPVDTVYAPDGRTAVIALSAVDAWKSVGWYTVPVSKVYAPDGRTAVIATSEVPSWIAVGWSCPTYTPAPTQSTTPAAKKNATYNDLTDFVNFMSLALEAQTTATKSLTYYYEYNYDAQFKSLFFDGIRTSYKAMKEAYNMSLNYSNLGIFSTQIKNIMNIQNDILNGKYSLLEMPSVLTKITSYHNEILEKLKSFL